MQLAIPPLDFVWCLTLNELWGVVTRGDICESAANPRTLTSVKGRGSPSRMRPRYDPVGALKMSGQAML